MELNLGEGWKDADNIENLRAVLYKYSDSIIENNITEEIILISEELDELILSYYREYEDND